MQIQLEAFKRASISHLSKSFLSSFIYCPWIDGVSIFFLPYKCDKFFPLFDVRYKAVMMEDVPRIFEAVFQCTLEVNTMQTTTLFRLLSVPLHNRFFLYSTDDY